MAPRTPAPAEHQAIHDGVLSMPPNSGANPLVPHQREPVNEPITQSALPSQVGRRRAVVVHPRGGLDIVVIEVCGSLRATVGELEQQVFRALASAPHAVVCDLTRVTSGPDPTSLRALAGLGAYPRDWPAVPIALTTRDERVRAGLLQDPVGRHLMVGACVDDVIPDLPVGPGDAVSTLQLYPHPTAPRAARIFVARSCLDWSLTSGLAGACLVAGELVSNSIARTSQRVEVAVSRHDELLRLSVRDHEGHLLAEGDDEWLRRRYVLVAGFSRAWGTLPAPGGGREVWAVLNG
jgi:hypothetical protein